jgi:hypothetical protein
MTATEIGEYAIGLLGITRPELTPVAYEIPPELADVARKAPAREEAR